MNHSEITEITGERYNIFGVNVTKLNPNKEEIERAKELQKECDLRETDGVITPEDIAISAVDIKIQKEVIAILLKKHKESKMHVIFSAIIATLLLIFGHILLIIPFLFAIIFFVRRMFNIENDYKLRNGFLSFLHFFHDEIGRAIYDKSYLPKLPGLTKEDVV
jgi:hypothetical protein